MSKHRGKVFCNREAFSSFTIMILSWESVFFRSPIVTYVTSVGSFTSYIAPKSLRVNPAVSSNFLLFLSIMLS